MRILIKLGGTLLEDAGSRLRLASEISEAAGANPVVVVHGGGKQMSHFLAERGIESRFVNGLRVTTPDVMDAVVKVFAGSVNVGLVAAFRAAGARPVGLTGVDAGLVDAEILNPDLGQVGKPVASDARLLETLVDAGYLPVVACVAGDGAGAVYNVNADQMAAACAAAFGAETLLFLTDVEGVRDARGRTCAVLSPQEARSMILEGVATGGMQAKLESALSAIRSGVAQVLIASGHQPGIVRRALESQAGTRLVP